MSYFQPYQPSSSTPGSSSSAANTIVATTSAGSAISKPCYRFHVWLERILKQGKKGRHSSKLQMISWATNPRKPEDPPFRMELFTLTSETIGGTLKRLYQEKSSYDSSKRTFRVYGDNLWFDKNGAHPCCIRVPGPMPEDIVEAPGNSRGMSKEQMTLRRITGYLQIRAVAPDLSDGTPVAGPASLPINRHPTPPSTLTPSGPSSSKTKSSVFTSPKLRELHQYHGKHPEQQRHVPQQDAVYLIDHEYLYIPARTGWTIPQRFTSSELWYNRQILDAAFEVFQEDPSKAFVCYLTLEKCPA